MFKEIKHLELTRHHLIVKTRKLMDRRQSEETSSFDKLNGVIFSSAFSLFTTLLLKFLFIDNNDRASLNQTVSASIFQVVLYFSLAIISYIVLYSISKICYNYISGKLKKFKAAVSTHCPDYSAQKNKELIDDFDHIALDNLLLAYESIDEMKTASNTQIATFYFYELIYYLKTAVAITSDITSQFRQKNCVNIEGNTDGVDLFRLINVQNMMSEIYMFIDETHRNRYVKSSGIQIEVPSDNSEDDDLRMALKEQLQNLNANISEIGEFCKNNKKNIFG